jgi:hypothetical protein
MSALVIRPVFRISETMVPPRHLPWASDFGRHLVVNREDVTPVDPAYQPLRKPGSAVNLWCSVEREQARKEIMPSTTASSFQRRLLSRFQLQTK